MAKYGERISKLRDQAGLTQEELAKKIGISRAALSHYEKNRREPDYETLLRFSDFFGVSTDFLLKGKQIQLIVDTDNPEYLIENPALIRFPIRLNKTMKEKGVSVKKLAEHISLNENEVFEFLLTSPIESLPGIGLLKKLSDLLDVPSSYLLGHSDSPNPVVVAGQEITLSKEELQFFNELKKHPIMFHDLASDPEAKVKELIKLYKMKKMFLEEDTTEHGDGFGELED